MVILVTEACRVSAALQEIFDTNFDWAGVNDALLVLQAVSDGILCNNCLLGTGASADTNTVSLHILIWV